MFVDDVAMAMTTPNISDQSQKKNKKHIAHCPYLPNYFIDQL